MRCKVYYVGDKDSAAKEIDNIEKKVYNDEVLSIKDINCIMCNHINPYRSMVTDMTPKEFELYCLETLNAYAEKENLNDFLIVHNQKISANDGIYQIDVYAEFTALGVKYKTIVECKKYIYPIEREQVAVLAGKVNSIGAQKVY